MNNTCKHAPAPQKAPAPAKRKNSFLRELLALLLKIAGVVLGVMLIFTFLYGLHRNMDPAMHPAIKDGDLVIYYRLDKQYVFGDVLLLDYEGKRQARRVVATAGDTVDITEAEGLLINGALQQEPDIHDPTRRYDTGVEFPLVVGEGQVFVLGDARNNSTDSRVYGPVNVEDTLGKVMTILRRRSM